MRALVLALPLLAACRMVPDEAEVKDLTPVTEAQDAEAVHGDAVAIRVEGDQVRRVLCALKGEPRRLEQVETTDCLMLSSEAVAEFLKKLGNDAGPELLEDRATGAAAAAIVAAATLDRRGQTLQAPASGGAAGVTPGGTPAAAPSGGTSGDAAFDAAIAQGYARLDRAAGGAGPTSSLPSAAYFSVPFAGLALSPVLDFSAYSASRVVHVSVQGAACGAQVVGVNAGSGPAALEPAANLGSGLFAGLGFKFVQVVVAQTAFKTGDCAVEVTANSGGAPTHGFDFGGGRACTAAADGAACPASPVIDACLNAAGDPAFCGDCSALCSVPVPVGGEWQAAGFAFYGGGYAPALGVAVLPNRKILAARLGSLDQCPGARLVALRLKPAPNGDVAAVSITLDGPFLFGECQIPVLVR